MVFSGIGLLVALSVFFIAVFSGLLILLGVIARQKEANARQRYPAARCIDRAASFFGQESLGVTQIRGNGTLILTDSDLVFERWAPNKEFRVPLGNIETIETPRSFLGKTRFTPLLKVVFINDRGSKDSMAWQVRDLNRWEQQIDEARTADPKVDPKVAHDDL